MSSLKNTLLKKIAKFLKRIINGKAEVSNEVDLETVSYFEGASQSEIPVKDIIDGIIQTNDNRYIGILEILPSNFRKKPAKEKDAIIEQYADLFARNDYKFDIKIMSDVANPRYLIKSIRKNCKNQNNPSIRKILNDYINFIIYLSNNRSVRKRYFYIFEYRSENGRKNGPIEDIKKTVNETLCSVKDTLEACGNICIIPDSKDKDSCTLEVLYYFFNRASYMNESFKDRYKRIKKDYDEFNRVTGMNKEFTYADLLAPKGLYFDNRNYVYMDGFFYGYLGIMGNSWPSLVNAGWFDYFDLGPSVDIDILCRKLPHESTKYAIKGVNKITEEGLKSAIRRGRENKATSIKGTYANNKYVFDEMEKGNALYNVAIILTFRANTPKRLADNMYRVKKAFKKKKIAVDDSFLKCEEYFKMTMPFLYITKPFRDLQHNTLASQLATMYCYTTYELNDPTGAVFGTSENSLASINIFNTNYYKNANTTIIGTSGAGKTFTEQLLGRRYMFNGMRNFFIVPKKGYEYEKGADAANGTYVRLFPGSDDCINIFEIKPEGTIDESVFSDDAEERKRYQRSSWRARKINNIILWINLLLKGRQLNQKEYSLLNKGITEIYESYGITNDNTSIFKDIKTQELKTMPIPQDLYDYCGRVEELVNVKDALEIFISGNCSNMNGQTNVNLDNDYIVFDVDEDLIGKDLLAAYLFIAFEFVYTEVKCKTTSRDIVWLDEVWKMLKDEQTAEQVQNLVKLLRGYGGAAVMATQEISDFMNAPNGFGKSVLNNSELTLVLNMKEEDLKLVKKNLKLTESDCKEILGFKRGYGKLIANGEKLNIQLEASDLEYSTYTTDVNDRIA